MRQWSVLAILFCVTGVRVFAQQPGKDGPLTIAAANTVVNKYAVLSADASAGATSIDVSDPGGPDGLDPATLALNDLLLLIQMQGATIDTSYRVVDFGSGNDESFALARFDTDGSLDLGFGASGKVTTPILGTNDQARAVAIQSDAKIVVAGWANNGGDNDVAVVRYDVNGAPDGTFGGGGIVTTPIGASDDEGFSVAIQADDKIVVAGDSHNGADDDLVVLRYLTGGGLDPGFGAGGIATTSVGPGDDSARDLALQADGKIVVTGSTWMVPISTSS